MPYQVPSLDYLQHLGDELLRLNVDDACELGLRDLITDLIAKSRASAIGSVDIEKVSLVLIGALFSVKPGGDLEKFIRLKLEHAPQQQEVVDESDFEVVAAPAAPTKIVLPDDEERITYVFHCYEYAKEFIPPNEVLVNTLAKTLKRMWDESQKTINGFLSKLPTLEMLKAQMKQVAYEYHVLIAGRLLYPKKKYHKPLVDFVLILERNCLAKKPADETDEDTTAHNIMGRNKLLGAIFMILLLNNSSGKLCSSIQEKILRGKAIHHIPQEFILLCLHATLAYISELRLKNKITAEDATNYIDALNRFTKAIIANEPSWKVKLMAKLLGYSVQCGAGVAATQYVSTAVTPLLSVLSSSLGISSIIPGAGMYLLTMFAITGALQIIPKAIDWTVQGASERAASTTANMIRRFREGKLEFHSDVNPSVEERLMRTLQALPKSIVSQKEKEKIEFAYGMEATNEDSLLMDIPDELFDESAPTEAAGAELSERSFTM